MEGQLSLLVVDDDDLDREAVRRALTRAGTTGHLVEVGDGDAALAALRTQRFDCALFDIRLPRESGIELLKRVRSAGVNLPVVMLTGFGDEQTAVESMKAGAADYIPKGQLSPEKLDKSIRHAVRVHQAEERAQRAQLQQQRQALQLRQVAAAAGSLSAPVREQELRARLVRAARSIIDVQAAAVWMAPEQPSRDAHAWYTVSAGHEEPRDVPVPIAESELDPAEWAHAIRKLTFETSQEPHWAARAQRLGLPGPVSGWLAVPLYGPARELVGVIQVTDKQQGEFDAGDEDILTQLAQLAANGIANGRLLHRTEQATRLRDDMIGVVSHDLRNPLAAVLMGTALILRKPPADEQRLRTQVERIDRAAQQMRGLIDDLMDVTRIEGGQMKLELSTVSSHGLVEDALEPLRAIATSKDISLDVQIDPDLPALAGDPGRLRQVFSNLVGNALKFTASGGRVMVRGQRDQSNVAFSIADTGVGIPAEHLPHIFDRYWQAPGTARLGAGLGLFIVKGIVDAHGGDIGVESRLGAGSTFRFTVPVARDQELPVAGAAGSACVSD